MERAADAANEYLQLEASGAFGEAASFARAFEEKASPAEFDAYLNFLDLAYLNVEAA